LRKNISHLSRFYVQTRKQQEEFIQNKTILFNLSKPDSSLLTLPPINDFRKMIQSFIICIKMESSKVKGSPSNKTIREMATLYSSHKAPTFMNKSFSLDSVSQHQLREYSYITDF